MPSQLNKTDTLFVAGHNGLVGSAIIRELKTQGYTSIFTATRQECDLTNATSVESFFNSHSIDTVFLSAAKVGGIVANESSPAEFIYENLMIQNNVIHQAYKSGVKRLYF